MEDSSSLQKSECAFSPGGCQTWVVLRVEGDRHWTYKFRTVQPLKSIALRCCASPEEVARVSPEKRGGRGGAKPTDLPSLFVRRLSLLEVLCSRQQSWAPSLLTACTHVQSFGRDG